MDTIAFLARTAPTNSTAFEAGSHVGTVLGIGIVSGAVIISLIMLANWPKGAKPSGLLLALPLLLGPIIPLVTGLLLESVITPEGISSTMYSSLIAGWGMWLAAFLYTAIAMGGKREEAGMYSIGIEQHPALARRNASSINRSRPRNKLPSTSKKPMAGIASQVRTGGILPQAPTSEAESETE